MHLVVAVGGSPWNVNLKGILEERKDFLSMAKWREKLRISIRSKCDLAVLFLTNVVPKTALRLL